MLANEEVIDGLSERRRPPRRAPAAAPVDAADHRLRRAPARRTSTDLDWPERIKELQRNWIGRSEGAEVDFAVAGLEREAHASSPPAPTRCSAPPTWCSPPSIRWSTSSPPTAQRDAVDGLLERGRAARATSSAPTWPRTRPASSPAPTPSTRSTASEIPVWIADYVLMGYGTGAIMAVPGPRRARLRVRREVRPAHRRTVAAAGRDFDGKAFTGDGPAINSGFLDGLPAAEAKAKIIAWLEEQGPGRAQGQLQAARLAVLAASATGASRSRSLQLADGTVPRARARRAAADCCPSWTTSSRPAPASRRWPAIDDWVADRPTRCSGQAPARDQHHAPVGRLLLVLPALHRPAQRRRRPGDPEQGAATGCRSTSTSAAPSTPCCTCSTRASGTRCSSTSASSRPASRSSKPAQPGHDPRRGRREDVQEPRQRRQPRRRHRRVRRRRAAPLRDVHGPAGAATSPGTRRASRACTASSPASGACSATRRTTLAPRSQDVDARRGRAARSCTGRIDDGHRP